MGHLFHESSDSTLRFSLLWKEHRSHVSDASPILLSFRAELLTFGSHMVCSDTIPSPAPYMTTIPMEPHQ